MLEQIRQSIEQAQMVLVGIGTEFAVKEEAQEDPFFNRIETKFPIQQKTSVEFSTDVLVIIGSYLQD